ncbi:Inducer of phenazine A [Streptomyces sp. NPDC001985]|uniref:Inducer of phenazine A n=1 Tax=Streptomyces sp. NPDC001985 TaxID=3154406 RepID=UPI0033206E42
MKLHRYELTPQMKQYDDFDNRGHTRYLPYLMYFNHTDYRSDVLNTDRYGFRFSHGPDGVRAAVDSEVAQGPVRLFVGSSVALGIGATSDATTIPSYLWTRYAPSAPWLNFSGRSFNSVQELILMLLHHHLLPRVEEIVILSGVNNLLLSRLPEWQHGDHGAFFYCNEYYELMEQLRTRHRRPGRRLWGRAARSQQPAPRAAAPAGAAVPDLDRLISHATALTERHVDGWRRLTAATGARISYVLTPLAPWIRQRPCAEEALLFAELDRLSGFGVPLDEMFGEIATLDAGRQYAQALRGVCEKQDVRFLEIAPLIADATAPDDWIFVDRGHFTDKGSDIFARVLAERLALS